MDFHCQLCGQTCKNKEEHALHFKGKRHGKMKEMLMPLHLIWGLMEFGYYQLMTLFIVGTIVSQGRVGY
jgi:hypothetical protein